MNASVNFIMSSAVLKFNIEYTINGYVCISIYSIILYYVIYYIILSYIILYHIILYHMILYHIILYHIILYCILMYIIYYMFIIHSTSRASNNEDDRHRHRNKDHVACGTAAMSHSVALLQRVPSNSIYIIYVSISI